VTGAEPLRICFVCLGNICRSPTAEAVMGWLVADAGLADRIEVDSAGTSGWHVGDPPDRRTAAEAARRGIAMTSRGRQFHPGDFAYFDLVVAMDRTNLADLVDLAPDASLRDRATLLRIFDPWVRDELAFGDPTTADPGVLLGPGMAGAGDLLDVPDPYYGGPDGFRLVFDLVEAACRGLLDHVRPRLS
jgi:protein-tyrosine phosphatase